MFAKSFALALAISLAMASAQAEELSINGIAVGSLATAASLAQLGIGPKAIQPCKPTPGAAFTCNGYMQLGGHEVSSAVDVGADQRIRRIFVTFQSVFFDDLDSVCILSWGKPSSTGSQAMQNGFGAQFLAIEHDWKQEGSRASILNYAGETVHGQIKLQLLP